LEELDVENLKEKLLARSFPRLQMSLLVALAGLGAFLCSVALLHGGLASMATRYFVSAAIGYLLFLGLIRLWIAYQRGTLSLDFPDLSELPVGGRPSAPPFSGGGGRFGGGGASQSLGGGHRSIGSVHHSAGSILDGLDELGLFVLGIAALLAGLIAVGLVVYASPVLFAEVLLDAAVASAVYRSALRHERSHWLKGVFRRTWLSAAALCLFVAAGGFLLQASAPEARSLGAVVRARLEAK
jgi:hypothetical protein